MISARLEFQKAAETFDNAGAANDFERRVTVAVGQLQSFPQAGRSGRVYGTREAVLARFPYIIIYRITADEVQILNLMHAARQWPSQSQ
nr:type II toxin-antitoxin system RelE/ParE family toxin [Rhodomicrobium sp. Az07]